VFFPLLVVVGLYFKIQQLERPPRTGGHCAKRPNLAAFDAGRVGSSRRGDFVDAGFALPGAGTVLAPWSVSFRFVTCFQEVWA
jgi:hypothetical protein